MRWSCVQNVMDLASQKNATNVEKWVKNSGIFFESMDGEE